MRLNKSSLFWCFTHSSENSTHLGSGDGWPKRHFLLAIQMEKLSGKEIETFQQIKFSIQIWSTLLDLHYKITRKIRYEGVNTSAE